MQRTTQLLQALPKPQMPADLWSGVAARITTAPHRVVWPWVWRTMVGIGLLGASVLIGLQAYHRPSTSLPLATGTTASYVSQHQLLSARDPLSDRASLGVVLASDQGSQ